MPTYKIQIRDTPNGPIGVRVPQDSKGLTLADYLILMGCVIIGVGVGIIVYQLLK